jgi:flavin-dependent dehydrogenase
VFAGRGQPRPATTFAKNRSYDYDVIVVGGRVAGAATAMLLAQHGHRVLIVERSSMPSDTVSTHAILRTGVLQLTRWGLIDQVVDAGTPPVRAITLGFGNERIVFDVRPDYGIDTLYAPRRYVLDDILATAAAKAGVDFRDKTTMTDLIHTDDGTVTGIRVGRGTDSEAITARWVIGADGHRSRVAHLTRSKFKESHQPTNAVHYAYYEGVGAHGFWFQFTPGVNAGLVPTNDGQCLVFVGRPNHLRQRFTADPDREFLRLIRLGGANLAGLVESGTRISGFRGTSGLAGFIRQAWGPGWALVGDAGYTKDPISAHGISDALRDAELCARAVDRAICEPERSAQALRWYETTRDTMSARMLAESQALARFEWDPAEASARMRVISDEVRAECATLLSLPEWTPLLAHT